MKDHSRCIPVLQFLPLLTFNVGRLLQKNNMISALILSFGLRGRYPIIGFTNYGALGPRYRIFDGDIPGGWEDLATPVAFGAWTSFDILFTGSAFEFLINDAVVYADITVNGSTGFSAVIMQAYTFADPTISNPNPVLADYTAHWSDRQGVPEPASLAGFVASRRRSI